MIWVISTCLIVLLGGIIYFFCSTEYDKPFEDE